MNEGKSIPELELIVTAMCNLQEHGGPDDAGIYSRETHHLVLGNRRLALLDLSSAGHQPMQYMHRYHITYNGELYNFKELKTELVKAGHQFNTQTDTEVIMAAYDQWGKYCFARFKGMFALALWDAQEEELLLVRDAAGIKPLYYATHTGGLSFSSEIRAFSAVPWLQETNHNWPIHLLAFGHIPEPVTTLNMVQPLPKGCFLTYSFLQKKITLQSFRHHSYSNAISSEEEATSMIRQTLGAAVKRHLLADVPIGSFLSGGLDSGIISMLASGEQKDQLISLSLYFQEEEYSEKAYQDIMIKKLGCKNHQFLLEENDFDTAFPRILKDMDMPSCDGINTWFISRYAKQLRLKAVLSGIGGDELLGGYPSFNRIAIANRLAALPGFLLALGKKSSFKQLNRLNYLSLPGIKGKYLFLRGYFTPNEIAKQLNMDEAQVWNELKKAPVLQEVNNLSQKNQASWMEYNLYLQNQLLRDADVMGMAHGVEIRVPFLDDDFIETCMHISGKVKYKGKNLKPLLVESFKNTLPPEIWQRPKMGFAFPFAEWLAKNAYVKDLLSGNDKVTSKNYQLFLKGKLHWSQLMSIVLVKNRMGSGQ